MPRIPIGITGWGSLSPLGSDEETVWSRYLEPRHLLQFEAKGGWAGRISADLEACLREWRQGKRNHRSLDRSVLMAMMAADSACRMAGWHGDQAFGIAIGSSRGATGLWEEYHAEFLRSGAAGLSPLTSPTTTLGNIASWTAQHLGARGPAIGHSITCSTALHSVLNAVTWIESGRCNRFLAGGSEAPLTAFTLAQMKALRIYTHPTAAPEEWPCRAGDPAKPANTMVLGEGAACFCLERSPSEALAWITGLGFGTERIATATSLSENGACLQQSMRGALAEAGLSTVDAVVTHSPGTILGDRAEQIAIRQVFGTDLPVQTNNKWKIGHTLGASGALSLEFALLLLQHRQLVEVPYLRAGSSGATAPRTVLINAVGFGGNAVSLVLTR